MLDIAATCLVITALLAYLNHRFVGIPTTIGVTAAALVISLALVALDAMGLSYGLRQYEESLLRSICNSTGVYLRRSPCRYVPCSCCWY